MLDSKRIEEELGIRKGGLDMEEKNEEMVINDQEAEKQKEEGEECVNANFKVDVTS